MLATVVASALVVALLLVVLVAGGGSSRGTGRGSTVVSMIEMAFEPDPIRVGEGEALEVVNDGALPHSLVIRGTGKGTPDLDPGESLSIDLDGVEPGRYDVICDLPGHAEAGMVTELVVG